MSVGENSKLTCSPDYACESDKYANVLSAKLGKTSNVLFAP
jgi:hypothetical protein